MLGFLNSIGPLELVIVLVIAVLIFGKDLPQAASKAYLQARKLRNAVDELRRDTGIDRELRHIERTVREAEWEARKGVDAAPQAAPASLPPSPAEPPAVTTPSPAPAESPGAARPDQPT